MQLLPSDWLSPLATERTFLSLAGSGASQRQGEMSTDKKTVQTDRCYKSSRKPAEKVMSVLKIAEEMEEFTFVCKVYLQSECIGR